MAEHDAAPEDELTEVEYDAEADAEADYDAEAEAEGTPKPRRKRLTPRGTATLVSVSLVVVAVALAGFLGFRTYQSEQAQKRQDLFLQVARQGALNLTTIDWQEADADIIRVLDGATGAFYDDFSNNSQPFVEVVKQAKSKSVGTVTEAGLESESGDLAQVLVAVSVKTTSVGAQEQQPRSWRMRIDVQRMGDQAKVSKVRFVQ